MRLSPQILLDYFSVTQTFYFSYVCSISLVFFFIYIYPPFMSKQIVWLCFGCCIHTRLGVAISEVSGPPVFHIKMGLSALLKDRTSELAALFSTASHKC